MRQAGHVDGRGEKIRCGQEGGPAAEEEEVVDCVVAGPWITPDTDDYRSGIEENVLAGEKREIGCNRCNDLASFKAQCVD